MRKIKKICDNCDKENGMCRYSPHDTPCPDFIISSRIVDEEKKKENNEMRNNLILRYAEILMNAGENRPDIDIIGQLARRAADSVMREIE